MRLPTVRAPGYAGTLRHACSTATRGAAASRALEARPVAHHGEVAAFRTGIPFETLEPRLVSDAKGGGGCLSDRDADDGRLGAGRQSDGWAVCQFVGPCAGSDRIIGDRDTAGRPAVQDVKVAAHKADASDAVDGVRRLVCRFRAGLGQEALALPAADPVGMQIGLLDVGKVTAPQIG